MHSGWLSKFPLRSMVIVFVAIPAPLHAQRFYADDPIDKEPTPIQVNQVKSRKLSAYYDLLDNTFFVRGERNAASKSVRSKSANTLGEVPDSPWYTNRIARHSMTIEDLVRGPGNENPPSVEGPWTILAPKTEGVTPGFLIKDSKGRIYQLKFDPLTNPEMSTAAEVIASKFYYAFGYNVHESYIVQCRREQLRVGPKTMLRDRYGKRRPMAERDVTDLLLNTPRTEGGLYRGVASLYFEGEPVGPFRFYGRRSDDPNDIIPHEHRRELRGLKVFCAWLNHDDSRAINTLDMLVEENGRRFLRHHLIDFGSTLGSASNRPNSPREGNEYLFSWRPSAIEFFSLGTYVPLWARVHYPNFPSVGRFEWQSFDPAKWVPMYPNAAFANCLPDDEFWAAKQIMALSDDQIRAVVKTGEYSDPRAEEWVIKCLIERRNKIGRAFFVQVLPLDHFSVEGGRLVFDDLAVKYELVSPRNYNVRWSRFDNQTQRESPMPGMNSVTIPGDVLSSPPGEFFAVGIDSGDAKKTITVFLRKDANEMKVVGVDRKW